MSSCKLLNAMCFLFRSLVKELDSSSGILVIGA